VEEMETALTEELNLVGGEAEAWYLHERIRRRYPILEIIPELNIIR
jgi:hypothetical protein